MKRVVFAALYTLTLLLCVSSYVHPVGEAQQASATGRVAGVQTDVPNVTFTQSTTPLDVNEIFRQVNEQRQKAGLAPLVADPELERIAVLRADDMVTNSYYAHKNTEGKIFYDVMQENGMSARFSCENLDLAGSTDATTYVNDWASSTKGHKECMLNSNTTRAGYAVRKMYDSQAEDGTVTTYYIVVAIHAGQ